MAIQSFQNGEYGIGPTPPPNATGAVVAAPSLSTNPPDIVTPAVPAASTFLFNTLGVDVTCYFLTAGTAATVTLKNASGTTEVTFAVRLGTVHIPSGWQISLGAYTVAPTWAWVAV